MNLFAVQRYPIQVAYSFKWEREMEEQMMKREMEEQMMKREMEEQMMKREMEEQMIQNNTNNFKKRLQLAFENKILTDQPASPSQPDFK